MELVGAHYVAAQMLSVIVYIALTAYVASNRTSRAAELPFIAFCLSQAFDAAAYLLLNTPDLPAGVPAVLRLRAAVAMLAPALFLHMAVNSYRGRHDLVGAAAAIGAYGIGGSAAVLVGLTDRIMLGAASTGVPGAYIVRAVLSPAGSALALLTTAINLTITLPLLLHALWRGVSPRSRSEARNVLAPATLLMLSILVRVPDLGQPASVSLAAGILQRTLSLGAGLLLANGVLRYGSPAGRPIHHRLSPVAIVLALAILVGVPPLLHPEHTAGTATLTTPLLTGLLVGVLLARPETLRLSDRLLRRPPPLESGFTDSLGRAWRILTAKDTRRLSPLELTRALQQEICAAHVEVLVRTLHPEEPEALVFTGDAGRPMVRLPARDLKWPITESTLRDRRIQSAGLPGPASLILPIREATDVVAILVVGEPERGGVYGRSEIMLAEMLANLLSAASGAGVPLVEHPDAAPADPKPGKTGPGRPAIRAFGRLVVIGPPDLGGFVPTVPLRARQLLALLLTAYPDPLPAETLMEGLWPEAVPRMAANSLYVAIHALRRTLEPNLATGMPSRYVLHEGDAYRLHLDDGIRLDVREFEDAYHRGEHNIRANQPEAAAREFQTALAHYRGPFLDEAVLYLSPQVEAVRHRAMLRCLEMAHFVVRHLGEAGRWQEANALVQALRQADPENEVFLDLVARISQRMFPPLAL